MDTKDFEKLYLAEKQRADKYYKAHSQLTNDFDLFKAKRDETIRNDIAKATKDLQGKLQTANLKNWFGEFEAGTAFQNGRKPEKLRKFVSAILKNNSFDSQGNFTKDGKPEKLEFAENKYSSVKEFYKAMHKEMGYGIEVGSSLSDRGIDTTGVDMLKRDIL